MRLAIAVALVTAGGSAHAGSRTAADHDVTPTSVRTKLEGPIATLTARYVIQADAGTYAESFAGIDLPPMGMVTAATVTAGGAAHVLSMLEAEDASTRFGALAVDEGDAASRGAKAAAVMISGQPGSAMIGVASGGGGALIVEVTVAAPTCFFRDARYVAVPPSWKAVAELAHRREPRDIGDVDAACPIVDHHGESTWIALPAAELAKRPSGERIGAFAGRIALGDEHVARVELDLSAALSDVPRDLATVILVDGSRSMTAQDLEAQRQLVMSYLRAAPDTRVQVLAYARRTKPLLPAWTTAAQGAARVDRELRAMAPRNGSNFDAGLTEAATWLARVDGTKRVVLLTDERMAERLELVPAATFKRLVPAGTLVHVVAVTGGTGIEPVRDEEAKLAPLAAATDGMAVRTGPVDPPQQLDATMLVRPISLDFLQVKAPGWSQMNIGTGTACGDETEHLLPEGGSCTWWGESDASGGPIIVEGLLWGKRIQRLVQPDPSRGRDLARELTAFESLDAPLLERAQQQAHAVNAKWSLYAQWGGSAGYTTGFGYGRAGWGSGCGCDSIGTIGHGTGTGGYWEPPDLAAQLRPLLAACGVETAHIHARLEMTLTEIVDLGVDITEAGDVPASTKRRHHQCVEDALWDAAPMLTHVEEKHIYDVDMPAIR